MDFVDFLNWRGEVVILSRDERNLFPKNLIYSPVVFGSIQKTFRSDLLDNNRDVHFEKESNLFAANFSTSASFENQSYLA